MKEVTVMKRSPLMFLLAAVVLMLPSCSKDEPLPVHQGSGTSAAAADPGTVTPMENLPAATTTVATTVPATSPAAAPGAIIASTDSEWPGVTLNVTELKRGSGGTVMMKFNVVNGSEKEVDAGYNFGDTSQSATDYNSVGGVHLIDPVGKKKYFVVRDADNKCVCSREAQGIKPGGRANWWAKFPAPPPDVQRVTVIVPHFIPMDDVPVS